MAKLRPVMTSGRGNGRAVSRSRSPNRKAPDESLSSTWSKEGLGELEMTATRQPQGIVLLLTPQALLYRVLRLPVSHQVSDTVCPRSW